MQLTAAFDMAPPPRSGPLAQTTAAGWRRDASASGTKSVSNGNRRHGMNGPETSQTTLYPAAAPPTVHPIANRHLVLAPIVHLSVVRNFATISTQFIG